MTPRRQRRMTIDDPCQFLDERSARGRALSRASSLGGSVLRTQSEKCLKSIEDRLRPGMPGLPRSNAGTCGRVPRRRECRMRQLRQERPPSYGRRLPASASPIRTTAGWLRREPFRPVAAVARSRSAPVRPATTLPRRLVVRPAAGLRGCVRYARRASSGSTQ